MNKVLIVFTDPHFAYSPTTLNLFYELQKDFRVKLLTFEPEPSYSSQKVNDTGVLYLECYNQNKETFFSLLNSAILKVKKRCNLLPNSKLLINSKAKKIIEYAKNFEGEIIAVDFFALWCVQQAGKESHLLSLEIPEYDAYRENCDFSKIKSVIIQSEERYNYIFTRTKPLCFFIQNAPPYIDFQPNYENRDKHHLIYCGSAMPAFGIISCLDFIKDYPEYKLTIKGAVPEVSRDAINLFYKDLIEENRLYIDGSYLDAASLTDYVSQFRIGFAFYDFYRNETVRSFNYYTAPSGKVFQYLNSGVPIVANSLPGFSFIEKNNAGVLIPYLSSNKIKSAIDKIEEAYTEMVINAKNLSKNLDFRKNVIPFIQFLKNETPH